jgi:hypothetical protein
MAGINLVSENNLQRLGRFSMPVGSKKPITIDISSTDASFPSTPCRMITACTGTVIYVDIAASDGVATNVPIPPDLPCVNIVGVHKTGTDCTLMLGWPME